MSDEVKATKKNNEKTNKLQDEINQRVGGSMYTARKEKKYSQTELADKANEYLRDKGLESEITFSNISNYENGKNEVPQYRLEAIAFALEKPVGWFFDNDYEEKKHPQACETFADAIRYIFALEDAFQSEFKAREEVVEGFYSAEYDRQVPDERICQLVFDIPRDLYLVLKNLAQMKQAYENGSIDLDLLFTMRNLIIEHQEKTRLENYYDDNLGELPF